MASRRAKILKGAQDGIQQGRHSSRFGSKAQGTAGLSRVTSVQIAVFPLIVVSALAAEQFLHSGKGSHFVIWFQATTDSIVTPLVVSVNNAVAW